MWMYVTILTVLLLSLNADCNSSFMDLFQVLILTGWPGIKVAAEMSVFKKTVMEEKEE